LRYSHFARIFTVGFREYALRSSSGVLPMRSLVVHELSFMSQNSPSQSLSAGEAVCGGRRGGWEGGGRRRRVKIGA
jgi:hypothetical protein